MATEIAVIALLSAPPTPRFPPHGSESEWGVGIRDWGRRRRRDDCYFCDCIELQPQLSVQL